MIVVCTKCQAKFRVPDDKIGPRGAKVRCSRCKSVFPVGPDGSTSSEGASSIPPVGEQGGGPPPAFLPEVDLEARSTRPVAPDVADPFATGSLALSPPLPPVAPAAETAAAVLRTVPPPLPAARPSQQYSTSPADPFAVAGFGEAFGAPPSSPADPFAVAAAADSAAADAGAADAPMLTDISDLLGPATPLEVPRPGAAGVPDASVSSAPPDVGLSLEDRLTPPPSPISPDPFAEPSAPLPGIDAAAPALSAEAGADPFAPSPDAFAPGAYGDEPLPGEEALAFAAEKASGEPVRAAAAPTWAAPAASAAPVADGSGHAGSEERGHARSPSLRWIAVNALALVALLTIAVAMLAVWRSEGPFEAAMLRPSSLLAALRSDSAPPPFAAMDVRSGVYEREKGPPLLFVRGRILSRAPRPVRAVEVGVEIVRDGHVIARGDALAGALPTPEELWMAPSAAALEAVARASSARAPALVRPGDAVPFLVTIADHPADLEGATVRFDLSPVEKKAP